MKFALIVPALALAAEGLAQPSPQTQRLALVPVVEVTRGWSFSSTKLDDLFAGALRKMGFDVVPAEQTENAAGVLDLDFTQKEQRTQQNFAAVGKRVRADMVALVVVDGVGMKLVGSGQDVVLEPWVKGKVWLLDEKTGLMLMSGASLQRHAEWKPLRTAQRIWESISSSARDAATVIFGS